MTDDLHSLLTKEDVDWRRIYDVIAKRTIRWKVNFDLAIQLLGKWKDSYDAFKDNGKKNDSQVRNLEVSVGLFTTQLAPLPSVQKRVSRRMADIVVAFLKNPKWRLCDAVKELASNISWKGLESRLPEVLVSFEKWIKENSDHMKDNSCSGIVEVLLSNVCKEIQYSKTWSKYTAYLCKILSLAVSQPLQLDNGYQDNGYGAVTTCIVNNYLNCSETKLDVDACTRFLPHLIRALTSTASEPLKLNVLEAISKIAVVEAPIVAPRIAELIDWCIEKDDTELPYFTELMLSTYPYNNDAVLTKLADLVGKMTENDDIYLTGLLALLADVAKQYPEKVEPHSTTVLESLGRGGDVTVNSLKVLASLTAYRPHEYVYLVDPLEELVVSGNEVDVLTVRVSEVLVTLTITEEIATKVLGIIFRSLEAVSDSQVAQLLTFVKEIGEKYPSCVVRYKDQIGKFRKNTSKEVQQISKNLQDMISTHGTVSNGLPDNDISTNHMNGDIVQPNNTPHTPRFDEEASRRTKLSSISVDDKVGWFHKYYYQLSSWALLLAYSNVKTHLKDQDQKIKKQEEKAVQQGLNIKDLAQTLIDQDKQMAELSTLVQRLQSYYGTTV